MNERTLGALGVALSLMLLGAACASERADLGPRNELSGDVGPGGFGGTPVLTAVTSGSGGAGGGLGVVSSAAAGGSGGGGCVDGGLEPNEDESTAPLVATITDCDGEGLVLQGILTSNADTDWYRYEASDVFGCVVDPEREVIANSPIRLCKYAECNQAPNNTVVTCQDGSTEATSSQGRPGCCYNTDFAMDIECDGADDDATVYLQVTQTLDACVSYTIDFHY